MRQLYRRIKVALNYRLDRLIDLCSALGTKAESTHPLIARAILKRTARACGDVLWLLRDLPRLPAYRLIGREGRAVFVGSEQGWLEIRHAIFSDEEVERQELGRVALWSLNARAQRWLKAGDHLVVCELSGAYPWRLKARYTFRVPIWLQQIVGIPDPPEKLLAGARMKGIRNNITRARREGFDYRFTQSDADFDVFYHRMYVPFVNARHGARAMVTGYERQLKQRFKRGGLLLITRHGKPVAGSLCRMAGNTCYSVEGGVADNDPEIVQYGFNALNLWYAAHWGHARGARFLNMGGSHAWRSNPAFAFKARWGAWVAGLPEVHSYWTFLMEDLPEPLMDRLNRIGFIGKINEKYCAVTLSPDAQRLDRPAQREAAAEAQRQGLAGIAIVTPGRITTCDAERGPAWP